MPGFSVYHASKWGIEGFAKATAKEVAPFGITLTIVEPGPTGTDFLAGLVRAEPSATYEDTPVGETRRAFDSRAFGTISDVGKSVDAMIASVDTSPAPQRLVLGSSAYNSIRAALTERLVALDAQKDIAFATDRDA